MNVNFDEDEVHKLLGILWSVATNAPDLVHIRTEAMERLRTINAGVRQARQALVDTMFEPPRAIPNVEPELPLEPVRRT